MADNEVNEQLRRENEELRKQLDDMGRQLERLTASIAILVEQRGHTAAGQQIGDPNQPVVPPQERQPIPHAPYDPIPMAYLNNQNRPNMFHRSMVLLYSKEIRG